MADLSANIGVLRRWANFNSEEPLPANFSQWATNNGTAAMQLQRQDPELVALLSGTASATLLADTLQGNLSPVPVSEEERQAAAKKKEMQSLYDAAKSEEGMTLTQKVQVQALYPELAKKIEKEVFTPSPAEELVSAQQRQAAQQLAEVKRSSVARSMAAFRRH